MSQAKKIIADLSTRLSNLQQPDGSFEANIMETGDCTPALFPTLLVCSFLTETDRISPNRTIAKMSSRAQALVRHSAGKNASWNYWKKGSSKSRSHPYPDDLDDTSLALSALQDPGPYMRENYFSHLRAADQGFGGPFNTWLVEAQKAGVHWRDVDPVTNANIAYCLNSMGIRIDGLDSFLHASLRKHNFHSKYYKNRSHVIYFLARAIHEPLTENDRAGLADLFDLSDTLSASLTLSTLIRLDFPRKSVESCYGQLVPLIKKGPDTDGCPIYIEGIRDGKISTVSSAAVTLSAAIEALSLYESTR